MSKPKDYKKVKEILDKPTPEEALDNLKIQLEGYHKQAKYYKEMTLKAQGAIEVLTQLNQDSEVQNES